MAGLVEAFVMKGLPDASVVYLTGLCNEFRIAIPDDKAEERAHLLKLVLRYLNSAALEGTDDKGASVFLKIYGELADELGDLNVGNNFTLPKLEDDNENRHSVVS